VSTQSDELVARRTGRTVTQPGILQYRSLIWNFAQRDLKARFKGTAVGWVWSLILPIASLLTYTLVAHYVFKGRAPVFGNGHKENFAVWLFAGLTAWGFFANGLNTAIGALLGAGPLIKKIYFPAYAPVLGSILAVVVQSLIELGLVLVSVALVGGGNIGWTWLLIPAWAGLFLVFVSSVSMIFAIANIFFRDLAHLVAVFLQLLFYATPVLYQENVLGHGRAHKVLVSNPVGQFVNLFRDLVYGLVPGAWGSWLYVFGWTVVALAGAVWVFKRHGRDLSEEL
jgi:ABC-type polysaccharide/polyol phosphate export permease